MIAEMRRDLADLSRSLAPDRGCSTRQTAALCEVCLDNGHIVVEGQLEQSMAHWRHTHGDIPIERWHCEMREAARVAPDDRIEISDHCFAVPSKLIREIVAARITAATVEVFHKGSRIASRALSPVRNRHTTITEHMPSAHRRYADGVD